MNTKINMEERKKKKKRKSARAEKNIYKTMKMI